MSADLDKAIDHAVHELMDAESRADLRARVIERIQRPRRTLRWTWIVAPIAAAAVVVIAVMLRWPTQVPERRVPVDIVLRAPEPAAGPLPAVTRPHGVVRVARRTSVPPRTRPTTLVAAEAARPTIELEPLRRIDAISVAPVALPSLDTQPIGVPPLTPIAQIELEPVNPSGGRN